MNRKRSAKVSGDPFLWKRQLRKAIQIEVLIGDHFYVEAVAQNKTPVPRRTPEKPWMAPFARLPEESAPPGAKRRRSIVEYNTLVIR